MANSTQRLGEPKRGQRMTAARESSLITQMRRLIRGGRGVLVESAGDQVVISVKPQGRGAGGLIVHKAPTFDELPAATGVDEGSFGRVTAGDDQGMMCVVDPSKTGWHSFTHWL